MQFKQILLITCLLFCTVFALAQQKKHKPTRYLKSFLRLADEANVAFAMPENFREIANKDNTLSFDYGMTIPGQQFEIWLRVIPQKNVDETMRDTSYIDIGNVEAKSLAGDENYFVRDMPGHVLDDYNADAGRTYLINLPDVALTKHYKYALLIFLQKKREGTMMAVCLTNDKGPDFFKNIIKARGCMHFKS